MTKRILVADDETSVVKVLKDRFNYWGYEVETAHDGEGTLEKVENFNPHLVVLDIKMPKLNGIKVLEKTKNRYPHIGILILTASQSEINFKTCSKKGVDGYVLKPETIKKQVEKIIKNSIKNIAHD